MDVVWIVLGLKDDAVVFRSRDADRGFDVGIHEGGETRLTGLQIANYAVQPWQLAHSSSFGPKHIPRAVSVVGRSPSPSPCSGEATWKLSEGHCCIAESRALCYPAQSRGNRLSRLPAG